MDYSAAFLCIFPQKKKKGYDITTFVCSPTPTPPVTTLTTLFHLKQWTAFYKHHIHTAQSISNCLHGPDITDLQINSFIAR
jgi:hypothetical protein